MISVGGKDDFKKDTLRNIEETKEFVVNSANEWLIEPVVHTAATYPPGINEMEKAGLTPLPSVKVKPPRIKEAAIHMECKLYKLISIPGKDMATSLILGEVVLFHIDEKAYENGRIHFEQIRNIGRLGGFGYGSIGKTFDIEIPKV